MFRNFILCLSLLFISSAQGAYLFFEKHERAFLPIEGKAIQHDIQEIMDTHSWPMVQNLFKVSTDPSTYSDLQALISSKPGAEEKFLRAKIQEKYPHIDLVWVPSILQELYAISMTSPEEGKHYKFIDPKEFIPFIFKINNHMVQDPLLQPLLSLKPSEFSNIDQAEKHLMPSYEQVIESMLERLDKGTFADVFREYQATGRFGQVLKTSISLELLAYMQNKFVLWRATTPVAITQADKSGPYVLDAPMNTDKELLTTKDYRLGFSISYAAYLFSGFYFDGGGCTFRIFTNMDKTTNPLLYSLLIDKKEFLKLYRYVLRMSPKVTPLNGLFDFGEMFHPRTYGEKKHSMQGGTVPFYPSGSKDNLPVAPLYSDAMFAHMAKQQLELNRESALPRIKILIEAAKFLKEHPTLSFDDFISRVSQHLNLDKSMQWTLQTAFGTEEAFGPEGVYTYLDTDISALAEEKLRKYTQMLEDFQKEISDTEIAKRVESIRKSLVPGDFDSASANWVFSRLLAESSYIIWVNQAPVVYDFSPFSRPYKYDPDIRRIKPGDLLDTQQMLSASLFQRVFMLPIREDIKLGKRKPLKEAPGPIAAKVRAEIAAARHHGS